MADVVQRIAMKAVIVNKEGKVLVLREAATYGDGTQRGRYHMPGGRIEAGENFEKPCGVKFAKSPGSILILNIHYT